VQENLAAARESAGAGRFDEAADAYLRAITASPDSAFLYRELAAVERQRRNQQSSLDYFKKAIELDPSDVGSIVQVGEILEERQELEAAIRVYSDAVKLESNEVINKRIEDLRARLALAALPPEYRGIAQSSPVTRGELAALIGVRLADLLQVSGRRDTVLSTDTRDHWAAPWILAVTAAGVMDPYPNHTFQPRGIVRRADLADAVSRLLKLIGSRRPALARQWQSAQPRATDVGAGNLSYEAVSLAVAAGVLPLLEGDTFQLARPVSGADAGDVIARLEALSQR
jgi:hypothetical protein